MPNMIVSFDDPLVAFLGLPLEEQTAFESLSEGILTGLEKYCKRRFVLDEYDDIFYNRTGEIYLNAYPVEYIIEVFGQQNNCIKISGPAGSSWAMGSTLHLIDVGSGVRTATDLDTMSSISDLIDDINNVSGWTASAPASMLSRPATDLVASTGGKTPGAIRIWDTSGDFSIDDRRGILNFFAGTGNYGPGNFWNDDMGYYNYNNSNYGNLGFNNSTQAVRVLWRGGYDPLPLDLVSVGVEMLSTIYTRTGRFKNFGGLISEHLDEYSYALRDANSPVLKGLLTPASLATLSSYRDRHI